MTVMVRVTATFDFAALFTLIELAFCCFRALHSFKTGTTALAGDINAATIIVWIAVFDAPQRTRSANGLNAIALALC